MHFSAGNKFSLFTGHMSFQIFLLVIHFINWMGDNLLTVNTLKMITQHVLMRCSVIVSDTNANLAGHFQNLVRQCPVTDCPALHLVNEVSYSGFQMTVESNHRIALVFTLSTLSLPLVPIGTYRFYSVLRQTILLVNGEPLGR